MLLSETAVKRPVFTVMAISALVVFGLIAYRTIGMAMFPDVDIPVVTVTVVYEGASPDTMETEVTELLEESAGTISGIKTMRSETSEGVTQIFLEFELETDVDIAAQDVRDKISAIRSELPLDSEPPVVEKFDPDSAPILGIVLSGDASIGELTYWADEVFKPRLESINGVGGVQLAGDRQREMRIWLRTDDLIAYNLTAQDVIDKVQAGNVEFPGGRIETEKQELIVKTKGRLSTAEQFKDMVVARNGDHVVRLQQVAFVEDGLEDQRSLSRLNGQPAVSMSVRQQSGTNMVAVAAEAKKALDKLRGELPDSFDLVVVQDNSEFVEKSVAEAQNELLRGGGLAVLVILLFLRSFRGSFIAAITIPSTIIATYAFMLAMGFTLNMMSLLALSISVGLVIDDSIVVLENCWRHMQEGKTRVQAAIAAMDEIGFAVISTSLSITAVFIPVAFMDGLVGKFFYEFGMTVAFAIVTSTIIALTLSPMLCSRLLKLNDKPGPLGRAVEWGFVALEKLYRRALEFGLRRRFTVLFTAIAVFVGSMMLLPYIGQEFAPVADEGQFLIQVEAPVGSSIGQTSSIAKRVEDIVAELPAIKNIYTTIGGQYEGYVSVAQVMVKMVDKEHRTISQAEAMQLARDRLAAYSHLRISVDNIERMSGGGFRSAPVQYNLRGDNTNELNAIGAELVARMKQSDGFVDVNTTTQSGKPELSVDIDRDRASDLGVDVEDLGKAINSLVGGQRISTFESGGKSYDVRVRLIAGDRQRSSALETLPVRKSDGALTELRNLATVNRTFGPVTIERQDRHRQVTILSNLKSSKPLGEAVEEVNQMAADIGLPDGVKAVFTGSAEMMAESFASILFCLFLAVILTYMVLAAQFESFLHPFTIMLSLPLSVGGAFGGLWLTGRTLNIFSMIGMVMLMGLVTKNAILLVDYANLLRKDGMSKDDALLKAGPVRLRPILMTAFSTVAGMMPIVLGFGDGAETRAPMGTCVVGGLVTSTLLTLLVIPVVYSLIDDARSLIPNTVRWISRIWSKPTASAAPEEPVGESVEERAGEKIASANGEAAATNGKRKRIDDTIPGVSPTASSEYD